MKKIPFCLVICLMIVGSLNSSGCISLKNTDNNSTTIQSIIEQTFLPRTPFPTPTCSDYSKGSIVMNPVGVHYVGDIFEITGTTDLPVGEKLNISVFPQVSVSAGGFKVSMPPEWRRQDGQAVIKPGQSGKNTWSFVFNSTGFTSHTLACR